MKNDKVIRILQIGMHDKIGGVETYLMNYYRHINKNKIQFDFINCYDKLCFEDEIISLGGKIFKVPNFKKKPISYYNKLKTIMKKNNYQIVHINMLSSANILPIIAAHRCHIKHIIVHSHNTDTPVGIMRKILDKINKKILIKYATDFFSCSKLAGDWLYDGTKDSVIINNAINLDKFKPNESIRNRIRKQLKVEKKFVIGHVGRFCYQKNHEFLINIFNEVRKKNNNAILLLIGIGELEEEIKHKVQELEIEDKVIFLGTTDKVNEYFNAMDLFVLPSRFEGLPVVGIEAQAMNLICLFSDKITKEAKILDTTTFLPLTNIYKWANVINNIINNKLQKHSQVIPKEYDINYAVKKLTQLYESMYKK